ncbi:SAM-dependent methyltransferase [Kitasatospora aureofaciens]|uniref:Methyltransferase type 11 n=1 Tax=Kitasatospora aureofaciens TaxID=1894 RepID=A0A1E7MX72_KITAU|nr:class I SAM-dependent methyltransferase [Kitasatospora aureofaciens]OEV32833.1 methyltransferase type 12 [Kitasatospora aureofaciens]QEV02911.1 SAM-dependent methyltransferase [Streptomyces viridifaciens]UKZ09530.1 class I SAM-dependent methyltransferase [Streptomyces viridifaciens]GGU57497.1 methyltransferase type 11 [Kitasatospora aureofaciens]
MTAPAAAWVDDPFAEAVRAGRGPLWLRQEDGARIPLDVERWCAPAAASDHSLLRRCLRLNAPVVDLGCGPGRLVAALLALGVPALGVDITGAAVARTRHLGGPALCRSVFDRLPAEGRWGAALLADGNLGIGGDPDALLRRGAELIAPNGLLLVEVEPEEVDERAVVRVEGPDGRLGPPFPWARLGPAATLRRARTAGLVEAERWTSHGRPFLALRKG